MAARGNIKRRWSAGANPAADTLRIRQKFTSLYAGQPCIARKKRKFTQKTPISDECFSQRSAEIVHTLFTPSLGSLKDLPLYFSHSLKQRATNIKILGFTVHLAERPKRQTKRSTAARCYNKSQESVQGNSTGESLPILFSRRCCFMFVFNSLREPFRILPRHPQAACGSAGAAGRPFRTCRTLSSRMPCGRARCERPRNSSLRSSRDESAWCS